MVRVSGYDITDYGDMVDCRPRMSAYAEALKRAVTPGCTVIDIGAGFGVFALLACKYGAGKVVAIEPDPSIELVMPMAQANGCAERITVVRGLSTEFTPDEKADVIVSDIRGTMPLFENHIETIVDARERLLKPGGAQLPLRDTIRLALAHAPDAYRLCERPWSVNEYDLDLSLGHEFAVNIPRRTHLGTEALLSDPFDLATLDYRTITDPGLDATVELVATQDGVAHGLLNWFDAEIAEGFGYSNGPARPELVYGQNLLPFPESVPMKAGDRVLARIRGMLAGGIYIWSWQCKIVDGATGETRHSFNQSTFKGSIRPAARLAPLEPGFVPTISAKLQIDRDCLSMVGDGRSLCEIADQLIERHPDDFTSIDEALDRVRTVLHRYAGSDQ